MTAFSAQFILKEKKQCKNIIHNFWQRHILGVVYCDEVEFFFRKKKPHTYTIVLNKLLSEKLTTENWAGIFSF